MGFLQEAMKRLRFWKVFNLKWADGTIFMIRYTLIKDLAARFPQYPKLPDSIKLHRFLRSDEDMHDHPWPFYSILIWRSYVEETPTGNARRRWLSVRYHPANYIHKVCVEPGREAWTLCLTWKREREWGFWIPAPDGGFEWVQHNDHRRQKGRAKVAL
jgi:hypothetical protein